MTCTLATDNPSSDVTRHLGDVIEQVTLVRLDNHRLAAVSGGTMTCTLGGGTVENIISGMLNLTFKLGQIGSASQNVLKLILKSPRFVPFGANLTQFGCKI